MGKKSTGNPADWSWLEDSYWYVRDQWLPAMQFAVSENQLSWQADQTVWHITGYRYGYFWGAVGVQIRPAGGTVPDRGPGSQPMPMTMIGSVTPEGSVQVAFSIASSSPLSKGANGPTVGSGRMAQYEGQPSFEMQMVSGSGTLTAHWAHMLQTREGEPSWESLPGVGVSVRDFMEGIAAPTDPVAPVGSDSEQ